MGIRKQLVVQNARGIHARTAAMVAGQAAKLSSELTFEMTLITAEGISCPITSMMMLSAQKIKKGDLITLDASGPDAKKALDRMATYLKGNIDDQIVSLDELDETLEQSAAIMASEFNSLREVETIFGAIMDHLSDGLCLMDERGRIRYLNRSYEKIFRCHKTTLIGKDAASLFPRRPSVSVLQTKKPEIGVLMRENGLEVIANSLPVYTGGSFSGVLTSYAPRGDVEKMAAALNRAEEQIRYYQKTLASMEGVNESFSAIIGRSPALTHALVMSSKVAKTAATVILRGESGTGKELVAKAIHQASDRAQGPFIKVNCAAIPENLIESELFGHEKGAFTDAYTKKLGRFELAAGGTLFLDEVGELGPSIQAKLLRILQEKTFSRVGGNEEIRVDIRILSATHRNLEEMVSKNQFREDLYYRLNVIPIELPPLRKRREDLPLLIDHLVTRYVNRDGLPRKRFSQPTMDIFRRYTWPGNIRELENIVLRCLMVAEDEIVMPGDLPEHMLHRANAPSSLINLYGDDVAPLEAYDREIFKRALEQHGTFNRAAQALGVTHRTVSLKAKKYGLKRKTDKK